MLKFMVFAEIGDTDLHFFTSREVANEYVASLLTEAEESVADLEGHYPGWAYDIAIYELKAEVKMIPFDGKLELTEVD